MASTKRQSLRAAFFLRQRPVPAAQNIKDKPGPALHNVLMPSAQGHARPTLEWRHDNESMDGAC